MIKIIVVTHGDFGAYLIEAAEGIAGVQKEGLKNVSISPKMSLEIINEVISKGVDELGTQEGLIFMTDMPGGTPMNVSLSIAAKIENSAVICGINISMMISAFMNRKNMDLEKLVEKIVNDGKRSICEVKSLLKKQNI